MSLPLHSVQRSLYLKLGKQLKLLSTGDRVVLKTLEFEQMYNSCYKLCTQFAQGRQLFRMFCKILRRAAALHTGSKEEYMFVAMMIRDVFSFPINTNFGGWHTNFDANVEKDRAWEGTSHRKGSLRSSVSSR
jgi:hypothetical protein